MKITLQELLTQLREERNWSLEELSRKTQIGVEKLALYEEGVSTPSVQTVLKLSNVLEVPASNLMDTLQK
ncbi:MAG: helix-turn-helix domain-containing protein [Lysinibacillus sp.]